MNILFWGPGDFPVSYSNKDTSWGTLDIVIQEVLCSIRDLIQQYEVSLSRMFNGILTFDEIQWLLNQSAFTPISWPWYRTLTSPNYEWFPWSICNRCGRPKWNLYPSGHLVPSPFLGLAYAPIVETSFPEVAVSFLDFSPWIPLDTFSILLWIPGFATFLFLKSLYHFRTLTLSNGLVRPRC